MPASEANAVASVNGAIALIFHLGRLGMRFLPVENHASQTHKLLDIRATSLIGTQEMELTAKSPRLLDWFWQHGPAPVADPEETPVEPEFDDNYRFIEPGDDE